MHWTHRLVNACIAMGAMAFVAAVDSPSTWAQSTTSTTSQAGIQHSAVNQDTECRKACCPATWADAAPGLSLILALTFLGFVWIRYSEAEAKSRWLVEALKVEKSDFATFLKVLSPDAAVKNKELLDRLQKVQTSLDDISKHTTENFEKIREQMSGKPASGNAATQGTQGPQ